MRPAVRSMLLLAATALTCGVLAVLPALDGDGASEAATPASGDFAGQVTIAGGRRIYLECHGVGSPTVILVSGLRGRGDAWYHADAGTIGGSVFEGVSAFTRTCIYDRPGTALGPGALSRSDPVSMPRTAGDAVDELHALIAAAALPGPYVLVGSSTGGLINRLYERTYPAEVAGLVLVDAISEGVRKAMSRKVWRFYNREYLLDAAPELSGYQALETIDFPASFSQMRIAGAKPPLPIPFVVISKRRPFGVPDRVPKGFSRSLERAWRAGQRYLASLSPTASRVVATESGHRISSEQPDLVIGETSLVVGQVRGG